MQHKYEAVLSEFHFSQNSWRNTRRARSCIRTTEPRVCPRRYGLERALRHTWSTAVTSLPIRTEPSKYAGRSRNNTNYVVRPMECLRLLQSKLAIELQHKFVCDNCEWKARQLENEAWISSKIRLPMFEAVRREDQNRLSNRKPLLL